MLRIWAILAIAGATVASFSCGGGAEDAITLQGSGASFPSPLYDKWFKTYHEKNPAVRINYQATGSGAGVKSFMAKEVDFGASDAAMKDDEIAKVEAGVVLLPMTAGSIVLAYKLDGIDKLKLSREAYTGIFNGEITKWNDPKIAAANEGVELPDLQITIARRSDGSGTTYVFTKHLSTISEKWKNGPGTGKTVEWLGNNIGGKGNQGVASLIQKTPGAIGYVEYGFATKSNPPLQMATLENQAGKFVEPTPEAASAALAAVELPDDLIAWVSDPSGEGSYPIVTYTWVLLYKKYQDPKTAEALKKVLTWSLDEGQSMSAELGYIPLPQNVRDRVKKALEQVQG